jgi:competence protein ComEA
MSRAKFYFSILLTIGFTLALIFSVLVTSGLTQQKIDLNTASEKELEAIKGVGPATAKKIVANRPYKSVDELSKAGLSANQTESLKPFFTVGATAPAPAPAQPVQPGQLTPSVAKAPATSAPKLAPGQTVNINNATKAELDALPGIGPVKAQAIIDGRPYKTKEDILKVKGIKQGEFSKIKDLITVD